MKHNETKIIIDGGEVVLHFNVESTFRALKQFNADTGEDLELKDLGVKLQELDKKGDDTQSLKILSLLLLCAAKEYSELEGEFDGLIGLKYPERLKPEHADKWLLKKFSGWITDNVDKIQGVVQTMVSGFGNKKIEPPQKAKKKD